MKTLSTELQEHVSGEVTLLCRCWIMETRNGTKLGFTDHDLDIEVDGVMCERNAGLESSGIEETLGLNVNTADVSGALQSDRITASDITAGKYDNAKVTTYLVNWSDPAHYAIDRVSSVGEITEEDGVFRMELRGLAASLDQTNGRHFVNRCQANLGDGKCGVDLNAAGRSAEAIVTKAISGERIEVSGLSGFDTGWFRHGQLSWLDGENSGREIEVLDHVFSQGVATVHLWQPMPFTILAGDHLKITTGCDKRYATCKEKFSNGLNFRGFPHVPGNRFALGYVSNQDVFDGSPIIP